MEEHNIYPLVFDATGAIFVYDERYPGPTKDLVAGYSLGLKRIREYGRDAVVGRVSKLKDQRAAKSAVDEYQEWLNSDEGRLHQENAKNWRDVRIDEALRRHKEKLLNAGIRAPGVIRISTNKRRITHCYSCKSHLDSSITPECLKCGWIICECGACGCQYSPNL